MALSQLIFQHIDLDDSGTIEPEELKSSPLASYLGDFFETLDSDEDGHISVLEWNAFFRNAEETRGEVFVRGLITRILYVGQIDVTDYLVESQGGVSSTELSDKVRAFHRNSIHSPEDKETVLETDDFHNGVVLIRKRFGFSREVFPSPEEQMEEHRNFKTFVEELKKEKLVRSAKKVFHKWDTSKTGALTLKDVIGVLESQAANSVLRGDADTESMGEGGEEKEGRREEEEVVEEEEKKSRQDEGTEDDDDEEGSAIEREITEKAFLRADTDCSERIDVHAFFRLLFGLSQELDLGAAETVFLTADIVETHERQRILNEICGFLSHRSNGFVMQRHLNSVIKRVEEKERDRIKLKESEEGGNTEESATDGQEKEKGSALKNADGYAKGDTVVYKGNSGTILRVDHPTQSVTLRYDSGAGSSREVNVPMESKKLSSLISEYDVVQIIDEMLGPRSADADEGSSAYFDRCYFILNEAFEEMKTTVLEELFTVIDRDKSGFLEFDEIGQSSL